MDKPDIAAVKAAAMEKIAVVRKEARDRKARKAIPIPRYVDMPDPTGNAEIDSEKDLSELESGFRKRAADEGRRFALATDTEFWAAISFHTSEQRNAFFAALGVTDLSIGNRYFDGNAIAQRLGISLPDTPEMPGVKTPDPTWIEFT